MNRRACLCFGVALLAAMTVVSCRTAELGFKVFDISGMIYDFSNRPIAHCEVSLSRNLKSSTDINGRFTLHKVPPGKYILTGIKKGFEYYSEEVTIKDAGQIIYVRMPSQYQLLNLVDESLSANDFTSAEEFAGRAYQIDKSNLEMLFYYATVKFRQNELVKAIDFLKEAGSLGSKDIYVEKFLNALKEMQNADEQE